MKYKKLMYVLLALNIALLFNIKKVDAADFSLDAGETSLSGLSGGGGGGSKSNSPIAYGYRVTFVDPNNNNKTVGHSYDYWGKGSMVSDNKCAIDGWICNADIFDWDFISNYSTYQNPSKTKIKYKYYDTKYNKTQSISGSGTIHEGKYSTNNSSADFLIPKYKKYLVEQTKCQNLNKNILLSFQVQDSCHDNNYVKFAYLSLKKAAQELDYETYAKLIKDTGAVNTNGKSDTEIVSAAKNYVIIVEPLTAIRANNSSNDKTLTNPIYIGTMYELYKMGAIEAVSGNNSWVYDRYSYINAKMYNKQAVGGIAACSNGTDGGKISNLDQGKCSGAFTVVIADLFPCASNVRNLYEKYNNGQLSAADYDKSVQKECTSANAGSCDWLKVGSDKSNPMYSKYGVNPSNINSCEMPSCNTVAKANSSKYTSSSTMRNFLSKLGYNIPSLANLDAYYSNPKIITDNNNLCASTACSTLLNTIKTSKVNVDAKIDALNKITGEQYALLNRTILDETGFEAKCDDVEACIVSPITPSCDSKNSTFTFEDATKGGNNSNCDITKIAYNKVNNQQVLANSVQTSTDDSYGSNAYCRESVTFNFPTDAQKTTGGTIMKWGTNSSKLNDVFGTMTVTRKCYSIGDKVNGGFIIYSDWANVIGGPLDTNNKGRINPKIEMNYKEAAPKDSKPIEISKVYMETDLSRFEMVIHSKNSSVDRAVSYYDNSGKLLSGTSVTFKNDANKTKYREYRCGDNCETIEYVEMIADYNITYPDSLKWYSDSKEYFDRKDAEEVENKGVADARYVALGYGLPTTFITPTNFNTVYGLSNDKTSGYMYVNLSNIGTKNQDNTYHFDRYTQYYIDDTYKNVLDTSKKTIKYSCNFSIENILYDYESDEDSEENKNTPYLEVNGKKVSSVIRTPNGIDVVFRTVELISDSKEIDVAFPGRSGSGRTIGLNWQLDNENEIQTNLLNKNIYEEEPKYVIDLNSTNIQKIRKSNEKNSYTSLEKYEFAKNKPAIDSTVLTKVGGLCKNGDKDSCRSYSYFLTKNQQYSKDTDSDIDYSYTYAASEFISTYAKNGELKGKCVKEQDTKKRAEKFAKTFGC